ncbi:MAG TPA: inositol monophosphatase family protein [Candidatus Sulfopaludibacter sp.]|jgi:myo-inositol-1(or 4)-monophosphatase|nr:inositol monophosphatase family protein [Candidatus Sulfopaludibacter sp.]
MQYLETAVEIAREAGALVVNYLERRVPFETKGEFDLITAADRASEKLIVERLRSYFPGHSIMAEEGGGVDKTSEYQWFVDPVDGTTNFAHSFPFFNVTLGLARGGEMVAGVVFDPVRQEMFTAERGAGAYLNNRRIHVSAAAHIADSLASTGFPSRKRHHNINIHFYYQLAMASHGVRRTGSAALDLAYVAAGRLDFFWEFGLKPWDMAAGTLLVQEAGGRVSDMRGEPHSVVGSDTLLVDNGLLHDEIVRSFGEIFSGHLRVPLPSIL